MSKKNLIAMRFSVAPMMDWTDERRDQGVSFVLDLTERKKVEGHCATRKRTWRMSCALLPWAN
jgi:hypothetical protein